VVVGRRNVIIFDGVHHDLLNILLFGVISFSAGVSRSPSMHLRLIPGATGGLFMWAQYSGEGNGGGLVIPDPSRGDVASSVTGLGGFARPSGSVCRGLFFAGTVAPVGGYAAAWDREHMPPKSWIGVFDRSAAFAVGITAWFRMAGARGLRRAAWACRGGLVRACRNGKEGLFLLSRPARFWRRNASARSDVGPAVARPFRQIASRSASESAGIDRGWLNFRWFGGWVLGRLDLAHMGERPR